jgi:hypothetical protein
MHIRVAIHFMHYNFVRIYQSLPVTPAMAAGVSKTLWSLTASFKISLCQLPTIAPE